MLLDFTKSCYSTETKRRVARERRKKIMQKILNRKKIVKKQPLWVKRSWQRNDRRNSKLCVESNGAVREIVEVVHLVARRI